MKRSLLLAGLLLCFGLAADAQCSTSGVPSYTSGCTGEYLTSVSATGAGITSTISYSGSSCAGSYFNDFATQGITAPTGSTITYNIQRCSGYAATVYVFVDWNNNGTYQLTESVGSAGLAVSATSATINFTVPLTGITTNTNLHMRLFLGEASISAPCSAHWGETVDYYLNATCTTPTLTVTPPSGIYCGASAVSLTASAAGATPTVYNWTPATGISPVTGPAVSATPAATTTYTVDAYGPGSCETTATALVTVAPPVVPVIAASGPTTLCQGQSVTLTETSGSGVSYQWFNGAAAIPGATNNTCLVSPSATTTYAVQVTTAAGCTGTATTTVTILPTPVAVITAAGPTTVCFPGTVQFNVNTGTGYTYRWFDGSSVIGGATSPSYIAAASGSYSAEITATSGCKDTSNSMVATINPKPAAAAFATAPLTICAYDSVVLTAAGAGGLSYQWLNGNTAIPGATNGTYVANVPGTYDYRLQVTNGFGCRDTTSSGLFPVVVNPAPVSAIVASGPLTICTGNSVGLSVPSVSGYSYQWYFDTVAGAGTPVTGATSSSLAASTTGFYYVTVVTPQGCTTSSEFSPAIVNAVTIPGITYTTSTSFCWGSNVMLSIGIGSAVPGVSYQWLRDSVSIPGAVGNEFTANASGTYSCYINVSGGCLDTTAPVTVVVEPLPNPIVTDSAGTLKTGNFYFSYQWFKNSVAIPGATNYRYTPVAVGDYTVLAVDSNHCVSMSTTFTVLTIPVNPAGVAQLSSNDGLTIYPNPATGKVFIVFAGYARAVISGLDGRQLLDDQGAKETDISALAPGLYVITIFDRDGNKITSRKLVKQP